jgi:hypothetical protein
VDVPALSARRLSAAILVLALTGGTATLAVASTSGGPAVAHGSKNDKDREGDRTSANSGQSGQGQSGNNDAADDSSAKSKDKDKDKGNGVPAAPAVPAPSAPAPARPTSSAPSTTTVPGTTTAPAAPAPLAPAAAPELGVSVGLAGVTGTVLVRTADGALKALDAASTLPTGAHVDTREGTVALTSAIDAQGTTQTGEFSGGIFAVRQSTGGRGTTQLVLLGGSWGGCRATSAGAQGLAHAARRKRKPIRSLWGKDDHGRFETRGRGSVATVRGTTWLTEDFCDGTRTTVTEGAVAVRNRSTGRVTVVRAGHSHFAHRSFK